MLGNHIHCTFKLTCFVLLCLQRFFLHLIWYQVFLFKTNSLYTVIWSQVSLAQLAGAVEYTDCFSAKGKTPPRNECPGYDTKQSDGEVLVMLELWGILSTSSLPFLSGPLWPGMVAPDRALSMG